MKMPPGVEVGLSPRNFMLDGDPASPPQKGGTPPPQFLAYFYCGQTAGYIKMPLGMEVGLIPGALCSMETRPLPQKGGGVAPNFRPMSIAAKRLHGPRCHLVQR